MYSRLISNALLYTIGIAALSCYRSSLTPCKRLLQRWSRLWLQALLYLPHPWGRRLWLLLRSASGSCPRISSRPQSFALLMGPAFHPAGTLLGCLLPLHLLAAPLPALVDNTWLTHNTNEVVVLDVRSRAEFIEGHWPQARWAGFKEFDWQVERYGRPGYLPSENKLAELLGSLGLEGSESVVVIGSAGHPRQIAEATRVVWSLMMAGFEQVALLDGGIESLSTNDLIKGTSHVESKECTISYQLELLADTNRVEDLLGNNRPVIDFRPTLYYEGYKRDPQVSEGGTIYDGVGIPPERVLDSDTGRFLPAKDIQQEFDRYDIQTSGTLATFSDTGIWAALGWFVLYKILENPQAQLYDGSMVEWIDWGGEVHDSTDDMGGPIG